MRLLLIPLFLLVTGALAAQPPAGNWKFRFDEEGRPITFLLAFSQSDGKWVGDFISSQPELKAEPKFGNVSFEGDLLKFSLSFNSKEFINFEGRVAKDGKKVTGTFSKFGGPLLLMDLYPSQLKKLNDTIALAREELSQIDSGAELFNLAFTVFGQAAEKKVSTDEIRSIADRVSKASAPYGPRWEKTMALRMATVLGEQTGYTDIALAQVRRAERMLPENPKPAESREVFQALVTVLEKGGKPEEAKKYVSSLQKLDELEYAEHLKAMLNFPMPDYAGRKAKSDRIVVVEHLTCSEDLVSAGTELGLQGLSRTFKPSDVLVLSYHYPAGGLDPMSCLDAIQRMNQYAEESKASLKLPFLLVNGVPGPAITPKEDKKQATPNDAAKLWYEGYRTAIEKELEKTTPVKMGIVPNKAEKGQSFKVSVSDVEKPSDKVVLRLFLVEPRVRYSGNNNVPFHENVVRAIPSGIKGLPITMKNFEHVVNFDVNELKNNQKEFLDELANRLRIPSLSNKPTDFKNLKLVALVQDTGTSEILQATQIDVK